MTVMIVGEAFGEEEEKLNAPFVGKSGKLLTSALNQVGLSRENFHITNIFMERPPDNNVYYFFGGFKADICEGIQAYNGKYLLEKFKFHLNRLVTEIEQQNPTLIISLGNVPYWCFTGNSGGITKARGKLLTETFGPVKLKTTYLPTYHSSYMLRNKTNKPVMDEWLSDIVIAKDYQ